VRASAWEPTANPTFNPNLTLEPPPRSQVPMGMSMLGTTSNLCVGRLGDRKREFRVLCSMGVAVRTDHYHGESALPPYGHHKLHLGYA